MAVGSRPDGTMEKPVFLGSGLSPERVSLGQGLFYLACGLWPLFDLRSFEQVTGPKPEGWLVKTVGSLVGVIGATLSLAALRRAVGPEMGLLGVGSAGALAMVDLWYAGWRKRIHPLYLLDAVAELALIGAWGLAFGRPGASERTPRAHRTGRPPSAQ
ncbi:MAG: hypothetical protein HY901_17630 [Deltaproteobacteria bacterium]|nr:hypothetical protein [Deltaproteobacteria bacterium]